VGMTDVGSLRPFPAGPSASFLSWREPPRDALLPPPKGGQETAVERRYMLTKGVCVRVIEA